MKKRYDETLTKDNKRSQEMGQRVFNINMRVECCSCFLTLYTLMLLRETYLLVAGLLLHYLELYKNVDQSSEQRSHDTE